MNSRLRPISLRSSPSSSMIAACTDTSRADVTSSQTSMAGSAASARAIATRWRSPPESWSGKRSAADADSATRSRHSPTFAPISRPPPRPKSLSLRAIVWPIVVRGFSDAYGFWKTYWISRRSSFERLRADCSSAVPRRLTSPVQFLWRPATQRAVVVLPLPDSPTSATHSLWWMSMSMSNRIWLSP